MLNTGKFATSKNNAIFFFSALFYSLCTSTAGEYRKFDNITQCEQSLTVVVVVVVNLHNLLDLMQINRWSSFRCQDLQKQLESHEEILYQENLFCVTANSHLMHYSQSGVIPHQLFKDTSCFDLRCESITGSPSVLNVLFGTRAARLQQWWNKRPSPTINVNCLLFLYM